MPALPYGLVAGHAAPIHHHTARQQCRSGRNVMGTTLCFACTHAVSRWSDDVTFVAVLSDENLWEAR